MAGVLLVNTCGAPALVLPPAVQGGQQRSLPRFLAVCCPPDSAHTNFTGLPPPYSPLLPTMVHAMAVATPTTRAWNCAAFGAGAKPTHASRSSTCLLRAARSKQPHQRCTRLAPAAPVRAAAAAAQPASAQASLQLATAKLPPVDRATFQQAMYNWAATLTTAGRNMPFALPLRVDPTPDGFQISLLRVVDSQVLSVADLVASVEAVQGGCAAKCTAGLHLGVRSRAAAARLARPASSWVAQ